MFVQQHSMFVHIRITPPQSALCGTVSEKWTTCRHLSFEARNQDSTKTAAARAHSIISRNSGTTSQRFQKARSYMAQVLKKLCATQRCFGICSSLASIIQGCRGDQCFLGCQQVTPSVILWQSRRSSYHSVYRWLTLSLLCHASYKLSWCFWLSWQFSTSFLSTDRVLPVLL